MVQLSSPHRTIDSLMSTMTKTTNYCRAMFCCLWYAQFFVFACGFDSPRRCGAALSFLHHRSYSRHRRCPPTRDPQRSAADDFCQRLFLFGRVSSPAAVKVEIAAAIKPDPTARSSSCTALGAAIDDQNDDGGSSSLPANFNPFDYRRGRSSESLNPTAESSDGAGGRRVARDSNAANGVISLRRMRMQEITNQLLQAAEEALSSSPTSLDVQEPTLKMKSILQEHGDFLLEPLENDDAVLEPDSIYSAAMTREQRYQAYRRSMKERIDKARNQAAKLVLRVLRDFVVSHE